MTDPDGARFMGGIVLDQLAALIARRRQALSDASYTRQLLDAGPEKCARKFGEEAIELVLAGAGSRADAVRDEAADVIYHLMVLLEAKGVPWADVCRTLEARMAQSGVQEKASRIPKG